MIIKIYNTKLLNIIYKLDKLCIFIIDQNAIIISSKLVSS